MHSAETYAASKDAPPRFLTYLVVHESPTSDEDINGNPISNYKWSATFKARSFSEAEKLALANLKTNDDKHSIICKIELF
jgi:hypothetical protein